MLVPKVFIVPLGGCPPHFRLAPDQSEWVELLCVVLPPRGQVGRVSVLDQRDRGAAASGAGGCGFSGHISYQLQLLAQNFFQLRPCGDHLGQPAGLLDGGVDALDHGWQRHRLFLLGTLHVAQRLLSRCAKRDDRVRAEAPDDAANVLDVVGWSALAVAGDNGGCVLEGPLVFLEHLTKHGEQAATGQTVAGKEQPGDHLMPTITVAVEQGVDALGVFGPGVLQDGEDFHR